MAGKKRLATALVGTCVASLTAGTTVMAGSGEVGSLSNLDASHERPHLMSQRMKPYASAELGVTSSDPMRGQPTFARASAQHPRPAQAFKMTMPELARWYLNRHAAAWQLSPESLSTLEVTKVLPLRGDGAIVTFAQRVDGVEVYGQHLKVLMDGERRLVAFSGNLHPDATPGSLAGKIRKGDPWHLTGPQALSTAFMDVHALGLSASDLLDTGRHSDLDRFYMLNPRSNAAREGVSFSRPARVRPVLFPAPEGLVKAWFVELMSDDLALDVPSDYAYVVSDRDGELLYRRDLIADVAFNYKVWAEASGIKRPLQGPLADFLPHPTGTPDGSYPASIAQTMVSMESFNGPGDPWLPEDATVTTGNNVDAYADLKANDGFTDGDVRGTASGPQTFDYAYDSTATAAATTTQLQASITQLFYTTNWLHDWYYDSGFTEKTGNAQKDNMGRGGFGGDIMLAQGQDYSGRNNANMSVPSDGSSPRMQMYIWDGYKESKVGVQPLNLSTIGGTAAFGPTNFDLSGGIVVAKDTGGLTTLCTANVADATGKVLLADRGTCTFEVKALNAQNAGAVGILIADNRSASAPPGMADDAATTTPITIGVQSLLQTEGNSIKTALGTTAQTATLHRFTGVEHDGTVDNTVIAHEWGHYLHHRLVAGASTQVSAQSEGWADFVALHMMVHEDDSLTGTYGLAQYAGVSIANSGYYGIRRYPYSIDFTKDPLTFKHIQTGTALPTTAPVNNNSSSNAEVHNAGEVWCTMMWESYAALLKTTQETASTRSFGEMQRLMGDYVVAGMDLSPSAPTMLDQRDALLAAISAMNKSDARVVAEAFARRGAGTCATGPASSSTDLVGVTESYTLSSLLKTGPLTLTESEESCDQDGVVDAGEIGYINIPILNVGPEPAGETTVTLSSTLAGVSFPAGNTATVEALEGFGSTTVAIPVKLDFSVADFASLDVKAILHNELACVTDLTATGLFAVNLDDLAQVSAVDTVESSHEGFKEEVAVGTTSWYRKAVSLYSHTWQGIDVGSLGDFRLVSPGLMVSKTSPFIITFEHKYKYETSTDSTTGVTTYWDGSVLEISKDDGATWEDMAVYKDPGYKGTIGNTASNPLSSRRAFVGQNPSYPNTDLVYLNLGTTFAGKTVRLRFRIGTDQASADEGWQIDNISFSGLLNTPFGALVADEGEGQDYYSDLDGDGFGDAETEALYCVQPAETVTDNTDCNDQSSDAYPGHAEVCDGIDNDCDGAVDEFAVDRVAYFADADQDGFGNAAQEQVACTRPEGYVTSSSDCDDTNAAINPAASEVCDSLDNNCDGQVDVSPTNGTVYYTDADGDGAGLESSGAAACSQPANTSTTAGDCDDTLATVAPGLAETCDGLDNNCNGVVDEEAVDVVTSYFDADQDGFGDADNAAVGCEVQVGYVSNAEDCNDADGLINPLAEEVCDGVDNNCDTLVDELNAETPTWYSDFDGDGHGDSEFSTQDCAAPTGYVSSSDDCNDQDASVYPGAPEAADGVDHNCDGVVTEPTPTPTPAATPTVTPEATPTATPEASPTQIVEATPTATPVQPTEEPTATPPVDSTPTVAPTGTPEVPVSGCSCDQSGSSPAPTAPLGLSALFIVSLLRLRRRASR